MSLQRHPAPQPDNENIFLPWERFREWVHCVAVVTFDLELGQTIETMYPQHVKLPEEEKSNVCYLSFPDSNSGCMGDTQFNFRMRHSLTKKDKRCRPGEGNYYNTQCIPALQTDPNFINGYVYFRQVKDSSLRRGYFQKSVVLLSKFSFVHLFNHILSLLAPQFFEFGISSIELGCRNICQWPSPTPGETLKLHFLGSEYEIQIPAATSGHAFSCGSPINSSAQFQDRMPPTPTSPVVITLQDVDFFQSLKPIISDLHLLWELVLTNEALVVMATVPDISANTVNALTQLIYPLRYAADFRPYFTIHDSDFKEYTMKSSTPPPVILGVTNPFFAKTLQKWPHVVRTGSSADSSVGKQKKNLKLLDAQPGVYTSYRCFLQKDKQLVKKILSGIKSHRPDEVQNIILRRHLQELTASFMIPLERYIASLMPLQRDVNPCKSPPEPRPFNPDDFLETVEKWGPQLTSGIKGDWPGLYKKFFRSVNFSHWYHLRYEEAKEKLEVLHLELISETDILNWVSGRTEVQAVDIVLKLRDRISNKNLQIRSTVRDKLRQQIIAILETLPDDMQSVLITHANSLAEFQ